MVDTQSMTRGVALTERPRRARTYRRRRWSDIVKRAATYAGRHRAPCQSPRSVEAEIEYAEGRLMLADWQRNYDAWSVRRAS